MLGQKKIFKRWVNPTCAFGFGWELLVVWICFIAPFILCLFTFYIPCVPHIQQSLCSSRISSPESWVLSHLFFLRPNAEAIDEAISSPVFWAMTKSIHEIALQAEWIGRWCEGCPCHEDVLLAWAFEQAKHRSASSVWQFYGHSLLHIFFEYGMVGSQLNCWIIEWLELE